jgi:hypothetical protein
VETLQLHTITPGSKDEAQASADAL